MPREPRFWWRRSPGLLGYLLVPAAIAYATVAQARWRLARSTRAGVPVICIGNFTVGGGGKTPTAIATARVLQETGANPFLLTRGYGGRKAGPHIVNLERDTARSVGDEPMLLATCAPTVVARDRPQGATLAVTHGAGAIVMDDGFQNPSLAKDLSIIALDAGAGVGNGLTLPAGPLRAPLAFQLGRADALVVIGEGRASEEIAACMAKRGKPVFRADYAPLDNTDWLTQKPVVAFAGIARPAKFFQTLERLGARLVDKISYPDHHPFTDNDAETLLKRAKNSNAGLVTTEKDWLRLVGSVGRLADLQNAVRPLPVVLRFADEEAEEAYARLLNSAVVASAA